MSVSNPEYAQTDMSFDIDNPIQETEIIFTAPLLYEDANSKAQTDCCSDPELPAEETERQVELLKAKLEANKTQRSATPLNVKLMRIKQILRETKSLNQESEKYNTQSAVLLSALENLKRELESAELEKADYFQKLKEIGSESIELNTRLVTRQDELQSLQDHSQATNQQAEALISELANLTKNSKFQQKELESELADFRRVLHQSQKESEEITSNHKLINELTEEAQRLVRSSAVENESISQKSSELSRLIAEFEASKSGCDALQTSLRTLQKSLETQQHQQEQLLETNRIQSQKTEKLNDEQITLLDLTQSRHTELRQELEATIATNKKYEEKLQQTEMQLKDSQTQHIGLKAQYDEAQEKLDANGSLLRNAAKALAEASQHSGKFNTSVSKFQVATEQSQHLVIRTQTTLESILSRNELLERENRVLNQRLNAKPSKTVTPSYAPKAPSATNTPQHNPFNPQSNHSQGLNKPQESSQGMFKIMMFLAVVVPLSFIAYSMISSASAAPNPSEPAVFIDNTPSALAVPHQP